MTAGPYNRSTPEEVKMPLSDHEERMLQEIERQLYEQDPRFARNVAGTTLQTYAIRNVRRGIALFALGFVVLVGFFFRPAVWIGVTAFLLMLIGATYAYHNARKTGTEQMKVLKDRAVVTKWFGRLEQRLRDFKKRDET